MPTDVPRPGLSVNMVRERKGPVPVDIPLVLEFECSELPFATIFRGTSALFTFLLKNKYIRLCT